MNAADSRTRESALAEIVRRFFLSKLGDEAAFELACLKLDRGEFLPAARLLSKIVSDYPDPTVRLGEIQLRLVAVNARVGDLALAREMLDEIKSQPIPPVPVGVIKLVEKDIEMVADNRGTASDRVGSWILPYGSPERTGLMPEAATDLPAGMIESWVQGYELTLPPGEEWEEIGRVQAAAEKKENPNREALALLLNDDPFQRQLNSQTKEPPTDEEIIARWKENGWLPVGQVLLNDGLIYFKTDDRVVCCNAATGELKWFGFRSEYPEDALATITANFSRSGRLTGQSSSPAGEREVISFSDTLNQSMSIVGDNLLVVQGRASDFYEDGDLDDAGAEEPPQRFGRFRVGGAQQLTDGRSRKNRLFSYHAKTGKLQWMLKPGEMMQESQRPMAFAGSPVPYGSLVVVPAYEATSLWLFGLDPASGKVLWKVFLADEPPGQTAMNSPVRVAIDGGEAYVATGAGIVASVDAISGTLNWAIAYPRTAPMSVKRDTRNAMSYYAPPKAELDGWADDTIIPSGNAIVFAASDFNCIAALDRRSGNLLWESARTPIEGEPESEYVLGISEGIVCVAGGKVVRAYKLDGGRLLWEHILEEQSYGRGMLSKSGIYIPMQDSIARLSVADGELLETIDVEAREGGRPLGNLYTDGERIYSVGFRKLDALRIREAGESLSEPAPRPRAQEEDSFDHLTMAVEVQKAIEMAYSRLAEVKDAEGVVLAGEGFEAAGDKLAEIAKRMEELGEPDAVTRESIGSLFERVNSRNAERLSESIGRILSNESDDGEFLSEIIKFRKRAEELPILRAYGIEIDPAKDEQPPEQ